VALFYLCGSGNVPYGGVRVCYRHVDILNRAGIAAHIVHDAANFRCTWFENSTKVATLPLRVTDSDVLVIPENWSGLLTSLAPGVPKVSFNQNAFTALQRYPLRDHPYLAAQDLLTSMTVSEQNLELLEYVFPGNVFHRIHLSIDPNVFHLPDKPPERQIAYMTRKRPGESRMVLDILRSRGVLCGWDVAVIDQLPESGVARALRSASLFLSFSQFEGLSLSPLEAIASGCSVIGYTGFGAREYFEQLGAVAVEDGDVVSFARKVETWMEEFDIAEHWVMARARSERCLQAYSPEREVKDVLEFWRAVVPQLPKSRGISYTVTRKDVRKGSLQLMLRHSAPLLRGGMQKVLGVAASRSLDR
jgi:hypothetical protein